MQRWLAFWSSLNVHQSSASFPGELVARRPRLTLFYANLTAYTYIPSSSELKDLQNRGYEVIAVDNGSLPAHLTQNPAVKIIAQSLSAAPRPE